MLANMKKQQEIRKIEEFLSVTQKKMNTHNFEPRHKTLLLVASHTNTKLKLENIKKSISFFELNNVTICVANTHNLKFNTELSEYYKKKQISYYENENHSYDFGKWLFLLNKIDYSSYDSIVFLNDSFIMLSPVHSFLNLSVYSDTELYGYNDSTEINYHYQSYLFSLKKTAIPKFIKMIENKISFMNTQDDVINEYELKMTRYFTHDCFLKIGHLPCNEKKNIFFTNDFLYKKLLNYKLLPFIKIKRIL